MKAIHVFYHADCLDGFGGAYAAWKKFGDNAAYTPLKYGHPPPLEEIQGKEVYFIDFCYPKEIMDQILAASKSLVVLDHHEGIQEVTKSMPSHVYDDKRSGATIAWEYFHPDTKTPSLLVHMEDEDLYRFALPDTRPLGVYLNAYDFTFEFWDEIAAALEDNKKRTKILDDARAYTKYFDHLVQVSIDHAHPIYFEGYKVLLANSAPVKTMKSAIGNALAKKMPPFALVASVHPHGLGISIRGDGSVDVSKIAQKYGGNGHPSSSGFAIPWQMPMPFTSAEDDHPTDARG